MSQLNNMRLKFLAKNLEFTTQGVGCARKHWKLRESAPVAMASENLPNLKKGDKFWFGLIKVVSHQSSIRKNPTPGTLKSRS